MPALNLEAEYSNRARVTNSTEIIARWAIEAAHARQHLPGQRDVAYGTKPRQVFDMYAAVGTRSAPLVVYIHGGYWQRGHGRDYAFVARELVARGVSVAIPSYTLCPDIRIAEIVDEIALFVSQLWVTTKVRPVLVGHSAGGHLAAMLMARGGIDGAPKDLIRTAYGISGAYDLEPLIGTTLNDALRLDPTEARAVSPRRGPIPTAGRTFVAAAGGDESSEFIRQAREFAAHWTQHGVAAECAIIPDTNHFTIVDELTRPDSPMLNRIVELAQTVAS